MDRIEIISGLAAAAANNGAGGLRIDGAHNVAAVKARVNLPIIGIHKRYYGTEVRITPDFASARALAEAGADLIALDCTARPSLSGESWPDLIERIHRELRLPVLADISTVAEGLAAAAAGADLIATTLHGATAETRYEQGPPWRLLRELVRRSRTPVLAEGRIGEPAEARRALAMGALAVVVGGAITRPGEITARFVQSIHPRVGHALGVDIGGTSVKAGLVDHTGELRNPIQVATDAHKGREGIAAAAGEAILQCLKLTQAEGIHPMGIGIASAGVIEFQTAQVFAATDNLPGWSGFDLRSHFSQQFDLPVYAENDAHAAVLAELHFGWGQTMDSFAMVTIGTGVGGGFVSSGHLLRGHQGFAGSLGHHTVRWDGLACNCGRLGCLEAYVSAPALVREYRKEVGDAEGITAAEICRRANAGEPPARRVLTAMADILAEGLANIWSCFDPEAVILGGGVVQDNALLLRQLERRLVEILPFAELRSPQLRVSRFGLYAGVQGAAVLALDAAADS